MPQSVAAAAAAATTTAAAAAAADADAVAADGVTKQLLLLPLEVLLHLPRGSLEGILPRWQTNPISLINEFVNKLALKICLPPGTWCPAPQARRTVAAASVAAVAAAARPSLTGGSGRRRHRRDCFLNKQIRSICEIRCFN